MNTKINSYDLVVARCFLALIFVVEGIWKIADADATRHYMQTRHLPGRSARAMRPLTEA